MTKYIGYRLVLIILIQLIIAEVLATGIVPEAAQ